MKTKFLYATLALALLTVVTAVTQAQQPSYRGTNRTVRQTILRIENRMDLFRNSLEAALNRNPVNTTSAYDDINLFVRDFEDSVRRLHERFDRRESTATDAQEVLNRAARIDDFIRRNPLDTRTQNYWSSMRVDLNQLAAAYSVTWPQTGGNQGRGNRLGGRLNGTYRIDVSHSDDPRQIADRATSGLPTTQRQRVLDSITRRLEAPEQIAIEVNGRTVSIASTRAPKITFEADGVERVETGPNGRTIRARATINRGVLTVTTTGNAGNDFTVTFEPLDDGQRLNVTRRLIAQGLNRPVVAQSQYEKSDSVARFDIYNPNNYPGQQYPGTTGSFVVPDGTTVVGVLDDSLSTRTSRVGDRFTLRVTQPGEFEGATIEGHVSAVERSGRLTGRSVLTLDFDNIRLRDGRTNQFAGILEGARTPNGDIVRVDTEGTVKDDNQTTKTVQRTAIGTAIGAIIGAIAGGGKGAAIGAVVGAGGGAGSVYVQGRDDLDLARGTELQIRAGAPANTPRN
jgi:YMGG-like Gly-zipper